MLKQSKCFLYPFSMHICWLGLTRVDSVCQPSTAGICFCPQLFCYLKDEKIFIMKQQDEEMCGFHQCSLSGFLSGRKRTWKSKRKQISEGKNSEPKLNYKPRKLQKPWDLNTRVESKHTLVRGGEAGLSQVGSGGQDNNLLGGGSGALWPHSRRSILGMPWHLIRGNGNANQHGMTWHSTAKSASEKAPLLSNSG